MRSKTVANHVCVLVCLALALHSAVLNAQTPAPAQSKEESPVFRSRSELVIVPTIVRGKTGHISGLKKEDFVLLEDGKPRQITTFEEVKSTSQSVQRAAVPEGEFTNKLLGLNAPRQVTVIAVDMINTAVIDQNFVRDALQKFVIQVSATGQPTALVALQSRSLRLIYNFTTDPKKLSAAIAAIKPGHPMKESASATLDNAQPATELMGQLDSEDGQAGTTEEDAQAVRRFQGWLEAKQGKEDLQQFQWRMGRFSTVEALEQLATWLSAVPGRKSLIWVTGGIPFSEAYGLGTNVKAMTTTMNRSASMEALDQQARLWERLSAANVAVYPVDARRLVNTAFDVMSPDRKYSASYTDKDLAQSREQDRVTTFEAIAQATGGKPCYNTPDLTRCFFEATQDSQNYYSIGYYVERDLKPGWHKLEVKCRQDGARVRARRGFLYASSEDAAARKEDLQMTMYSPLQISALRFRGRWTGQTPLSNGKRKIAFELQIPPDSITIDTANQNQIELDIAGVVFDSKGQLVSSFAQTVKQHPPEEGVAQLRSFGMTYTNALQAPPGDYLARVVVRDDLTRRVGSVLVTLKVQ